MYQKKEEGPVLSPLWGGWPLLPPAWVEIALVMADASRLTARQPFSTLYVRCMNLFNPHWLGQGHEAEVWQARVQALNCMLFCFSGNSKSPVDERPVLPSLPPQ